MRSPAELYDELVTRLELYDEKFILQFMPADPSTSPSEYETEVRSYCILCHACFEEFYESIALAILLKVEHAWLHSKKTSSATVMLIGCTATSVALPSENTDAETTIYEYTRLAISNAKRVISKSIHDNHGAAPKHLRKLLTSVGLEFNPDAITKNSIVKLSDERGKYAHKGFLTSIMPPEDATAYVLDCLKFSEGVRDNAIAALQELE